MQKEVEVKVQQEDDYVEIDSSNLYELDNPENKNTAQSPRPQSPIEDDATTANPEDFDLDQEHADSNIAFTEKQEDQNSEQSQEEPIDFFEFTGLNSVPMVVKNTWQDFLDGLDSVATDVRDFFSEKAEENTEQGIKHLATGIVLEGAVHRMSSKPDTPERQATEAVLNLAALYEFNAANKDCTRVKTDLTIASTAEVIRETAAILKKASLDSDDDETPKATMYRLAIEKAAAPTLRQLAATADEPKPAPQPAKKKNKKSKKI